MCALRNLVTNKWVKGDRRTFATRNLAYPREDGGRHFAEILDAILAGGPRPSPRIVAAEHLERFSYPALLARARKLIDALARLDAAPQARCARE